MEERVWLVVAILAVLIIIAAGAAIITFMKSKKGTGKEPNYRVFYNMGIIFLPIGIAFIVLSLFTEFSFVIAIPYIGIGATYIAIGSANRDKWQKKS